MQNEERNGLVNYAWENTKWCWDWQENQRCNMYLRINCTSNDDEANIGKLMLSVICWLMLMVHMGWSPTYKKSNIARVIHI